MKKKLLSLLVVFAMALSMVPMVSAVTDGNGNATDFYKNYGVTDSSVVGYDTPAEPQTLTVNTAGLEDGCEITTAEQLFSLLTGSLGDTSAWTVTLGNDIDFDGYYLSYKNATFAGTLDGNNHKLSHMAIRTGDETIVSTVAFGGRGIATEGAYLDIINNYNPLALKSDLDRGEDEAKACNNNDLQGMACQRRRRAVGGRRRLYAFGGYELLSEVGAQ